MIPEQDISPLRGGKEREMNYEVREEGDITTGKIIVETRKYSLCTHNLNIPCPRRKTLQGGYVVCGDIFGKIGTSCPIDDYIEEICREEGSAYIPKEYEKFINK